MDKEQQIERFISKPFEIGELAYVKGLGSSNKESKGDLATITSFEDDFVFVKYHNRIEKYPISYLSKYTGNIGYNPFPKKAWNTDIKFLNYSLQSVLSEIGFDTWTYEFKKEKVAGKEINEVNWNPFVYKNKKLYRFQRPFCWDLAQKMSLIDSIYQNINIGTFIIKTNAWEYVEYYTKINIDVGFADIIDGKQRLKALCDFLQNKFTDSSGNYFEDFSEKAQRDFLDFNQLSCGIMQSSASANDVLRAFLNINFNGVPMSKDHIKFVKDMLEENS